MKDLFLKNFLLLAGSLLLAHTHSVWAEESGVNVTFSFYDDDVLGERLVVSPQVRSDDLSGSLEMRLNDQAYYDHRQFDFSIREVATVSGQGLGNEGLIFIVENDKNREEFIQVLDIFVENAQKFRQNRNEFAAKVEPWMGSGDRMLSGSRSLGIIQTDFIDKPSDVTLNWDLSLNRLWLSIDGFVNIDSRFATTLHDLVTRVPEFSQTRKKMSRELKEKNEAIAKSLGMDSAN